MFNSFIISVMLKMIRQKLIMNVLCRLHEVDESIAELPEMENPESEKLRTFVSWLNSSKPYQAPIKVIRYVRN